jgi:hypothetical protein
MSMLAELVELVIGVDTHADTHTAALIAVDTRAVVATATVTADPDGYAQLLALADSTAGCAAGRWKAPAATAPVWPDTSASEVSWSSSSTARCVRRGGPGRSPM